MAANGNAKKREICSGFKICHDTFFTYIAHSQIGTGSTRASWEVLSGRDSGRDSQADGGGQESHGGICIITRAPKS